MLAKTPVKPSHRSVPGRGGRQEGVPGTGHHCSSQRYRKDWLGPPAPYPTGLGDRWPWFGEGMEPCWQVGSHPGPP